jgi:monovalent cation/proton antiporter MnhG/PhaG subunit
VTALAIDALLAAAVAASWLGTVALLRLEGAYARLHAASYVGVVCGTLIVAAVVIADPLSALTMKALLMLAAMIVGGAVAIHSLARAMRERGESGDRP